MHSVSVFDVIIQMTLNFNGHTHTMWMRDREIQTFDFGWSLSLICHDSGRLAYEIKSNEAFYMVFSKESTKTQNLNRKHFWLNHIILMKNRNRFTVNWIELFYWENRLKMMMLWRHEVDRRLECVLNTTVELCRYMYALTLHQFI